MRLKGFCPCPVSPEGRGIPVNSEAVPGADSTRRQGRAALGSSHPSPDSETKVSREPDLELASEGHPPGMPAKGLSSQPKETRVPRNEGYSRRSLARMFLRNLNPCPNLKESVLVASPNLNLLRCGPACD